MVEKTGSIEDDAAQTAVRCLVEATTVDGPRVRAVGIHTQVSERRITVTSRTRKQNSHVKAPVEQVTGGEFVAEQEHTPTPQLFKCIKLHNRSIS